MNGPEDVAVELDFVDWRVYEQNVIRLRRRIFKATREQDWATVRSLQKLMLGSWSNTLVSVRQVTQRNTGRRDGRYRRRGRLVVAGVGGDGGACAPQPLGLGPVAGSARVHSTAHRRLAQTYRHGRFCSPAMPRTHMYRSAGRHADRSP
jgi:hypothetical protein